MSIKTIILSCILLLSVAGLAIAWAVLPAGTLPYDKPKQRQVLTHVVTDHRKVRVVKVIHRKAPLLVARSAASPGSYANNSGIAAPAGRGAVQPSTPSVQRGSERQYESRESYHDSSEDRYENETEEEEHDQEGEDREDEDNE